MSRLKKYYKEKVLKELQEKFGFENPMLIPGLTKIVVNMGVAEASRDKNQLQDAVRELTALTGQKPLVCKARTSISNFKLREGMPIGLKVTLRGQRMYEFLDRFCNIVAPRIRDFRGFATKCDGRGNYSIGLDDQQVFPEVDLDQVKRTQGMQLTFVTSANKDEHCVELLRLLGMPYKDLPVVVTTTSK
jgi:large subunit ribosomal protein L5